MAAEGFLGNVVYFRVRAQSTRSSHGGNELHVNRCPWVIRAAVSGVIRERVKNVFIV